jgi:ribosomal protein S18 acetylase RimI-like enzyme
MPSLVVRAAEPGDARAIAELHVEAWRAAYAGLLPDELLAALSVDARERMWRELLAAGASAPVLVAEAGGGIGGFCALAVPARDDDAGERTAEVGAIYVEPALWRSGIGTALMDAAEAGLRERGCDDIVLWVLPENEPAVGFYERRGFERDGAERREEGSGALVVRLRRVL